MTAAIIFPLIFVGAWVFASWYVSRLSGWHKLALRFTLRNDFPCDRWRYKSARMRYKINYNNCLTIGASPVGFYLAMPWLFRMSHPALFVPWTEISYRPAKILWMDAIRFDLGREDPIPFTVRKNLAGQIRCAAGASWPPEQIV